MNTSLATLLDWANAHEINLDNCQISFGLVGAPLNDKGEPDWNKPARPYVQLTFFHRKEKHRNILNLKRVVKLKEKGTPPYVELVADYFIDALNLRVRYEGAFECEIEHHCAPAKWNPDQLDEPMTEPGI